MAELSKELFIIANTVSTIPTLEIESYGKEYSLENWNFLALKEKNAPNLWSIRIPKNNFETQSLQTELALLKKLIIESIAGAIPFNIPNPNKIIKLPHSQTEILLYPHIAGKQLKMEFVNEQNSVLCENLGIAIAAIHEVETSLIQGIGLQENSCEDIRAELINTLDSVEKSNYLSQRLLARYRKFLNDKEAWDFLPTLTHGELRTEDILIDGNLVSGIMNFNNAKITCPSEDLAPFLNFVSPEASSIIFKSYLNTRTNIDPNLERRISFMSEFMYVIWLFHGIVQKDSTVINSALEQLSGIEVLLFENTSAENVSEVIQDLNKTGNIPKITQTDLETLENSQSYALNSYGDDRINSSKNNEKQSLDTQMPISQEEALEVLDKTESAEGEFEVDELNIENSEINDFSDLPKEDQDAPL